MRGDRTRQVRLSACFFLLLSFGLSCRTQQTTPPDAGVPVRLTLFLTGAENGYLLPTPSAEGLRGGAAEVLARWVADGHCVGPLGLNGEPACPRDGTLVASTGDNANGAAISSYFRGASTAELMRHMGFAASAFGNRELDWSREQFTANTAAGGFPYLAANLEASGDEGRALNLRAFRVVERVGVKVGLIGLAARKATQTPMPGRTAGLTLVPEDFALKKVIPQARAAGAETLVVITDGCLDEVPALLTAIAPLHVDVVAGRDCGSKWPSRVGATALVYPGRHFNTYARVVVTVDPARPHGERTISLEASVVEVVGGSPEPTARVLLEAWKLKLETALGEVIGTSNAGIEQESAAMSAWLTTALREQFKTDFALLNRKGVRQALPKGPLTKATIWDLVPFENEVVVIRVSGAAFKAALTNIEARASGVRELGETFTDLKGNPLDDARIYTVATTDYLYLGGDGFKLREADPSPAQTHISIQTALIDWTKARRSTANFPLEDVVGRK